MKQLDLPRRISFLLFLITVILSPGISFGQAGQLDPSFNSADHGASPIDGADNDVRTLALQPDGKIIIGGIFNSFGGTTGKGITRITANGLPDASFNAGGTGTDGPVYKVALQPDGKIIIAGKFNNYNGSAAGKIIRLNADGSKDATFITGTGFNDSINIVSVQADGKILVGGNFTIYNGVATNYLVRLNADGSKDGLFTPVGVGSTVNDLAIQTDNKILVGMQGTGFLTRLTSSGAADPTFNIASSGVNSIVKTIKIQPDGKILIGGLHYVPDYYAGIVMRLNTDGSLDAGFSSGTYEQIDVITLQADGKILIGHGIYYDRFSYMAGTKMSRLNTNGSVDATFNYSFDATHFNQNVYAILVQPDGKILSAESSKYLTSYREVTFPYYSSAKDFKIRRYNSDGSDDVNFGINTSATGSARQINTTVLQADGKLLVGGYFYAFNGTIANNIVRINANGTVDATFNAGGSGFDYAVNAIAIQPDGKIVVAGYFSKYNGQPYKEIIRLNSNGSIDPTFTSNLADFNWVRSISIQADGKIIVAGALYGALKRLNTDGSIDNSFSVTFTNMLGMDIPDIYTTLIQPDGKFLVGGHYRRTTGANTSFVGGITRFTANGVRDTTFNGRWVDEEGTPTLVGPNGDVTAIAVQPDGKVLIGGTFTYYTTYNTNTAVNRITRLTAGGVIDPTFNVGTGVNDVVRSIAVLPSGKILIAGSFTSYNGTAVGGLIRLNADGTLDNSFNPNGAGASIVSINSITVEPGAARFYINGDFTSYNGTGKNRIARIFNDDAGAPVDCTVGNITGPDRACQYITAGTNAVYQINAPVGSTITWTVSAAATMSIVSGQGTNSVNVHFANNFSAGAVYAHVVNATCSVNVNKSITVKVTAPSAPGAITASNSSVCSVLGTANTITYKINKVTSATSYNWVAQAGSTVITHPNGPGANDTIINVAFANNFTSSQITVQAVNDCSASSTRILNVNVTPPATPASISGPTYVCAYLLPTPVGGPAVYTTPAVAGVTYNWILPAGAGSVTGQGTNSISFYFPAGFTTGSVSVTATNGCGTSAAKVMTVKAGLPQTPGAITAALVSDCPNRIYTYSIASIPVNATSIIWDVPAGGQITNGQGTTTITVSYTTTAITGYVSLHSYNACGASTVRKIAVNLAACSPAPPAPFAKNGGTDQQTANATTNTTTANTIAKATNAQTLVDGMDVKVYPNPSASEFNLLVNTSAKEVISMKVLDIAGRFISQTNIAPYKTIKLGAGLQPGIYIIEVRQGNNIKTTRAIKL